jgi:hypothetical protein
VRVQGAALKCEPDHVAPWTPPGLRGRAPEPGERREQPIEHLEGRLLMSASETITAPPGDVRARPGDDATSPAPKTVRKSRTPAAPSPASGRATQETGPRSSADATAPSLRTAPRRFAAPSHPANPTEPTRPAEPATARCRHPLHAGCALAAIDDEPTTWTQRGRCFDRGRATPPSTREPTGRPRAPRGPHGGDDSVGASTRDILANH